MMLTQIGLSPIGKGAAAGSARRCVGSSGVEAGGDWGINGKQTIQSPVVYTAQGAGKRW